MLNMFEMFVFLVGCTTICAIVFSTAWRIVFTGEDFKRDPLREALEAYWSTRDRGCNVLISMGIAYDTFKHGFK